MIDRLGQQLGEYRLTNKLGEGGFAEVYLGEHIYLKRHAAIKVLKVRLGSDDLQSFLKEAQTVATLKHEHIIAVLGFSIESKTNIPFLIMEYAPAGSLRLRHPKGQRLPLTTVISYVKQVAAALQYSHDKRVIHRDIKPENMLIGSHGEVLLSDFGVATEAHSTRSQREEKADGTITYMAPEQFQGHPRPASDQYALGIVVYEWLCGSPPFTEGNSIHLAYQHNHVSPPSLRSKNPAISAAVEQVVLKALAKDPSQRFPTVQEFATALEHAAQVRQPVHPAPQPARLERAAQTKQKVPQIVPPQQRQAEIERGKARTHRILISILLIPVLVGGIFWAYNSISTPDKTLDTYCAALQRGDSNTANDQVTNYYLNHSSDPTAEHFDADACTHNPASSEYQSPAGTTARASITFHLTHGGFKPMIAFLVKENGIWKIDAFVNP
jgi:serine/threonine protein kinase